MTAPFIQPGEHLQRTTRGWSDDFSDQHGRRFSAQYQLSNSRPIGELAPEGHTPPWLPPQRFIKWERKEGGFRFRWDYDAMASELAELSDQFYTEVAQFMMEHMPNEPVPETGEPIPARALRFVGKPSLSPAIPLACEAGDPWMLGVPGAPVNEMLRDLLNQTVQANGRQALAIIRAKLAARTTNPVPTVPLADDPAVVKRTRSIDDVDLSLLSTVTYQQFIGAAMKGGMTMADAAVAWKAHRENLALEGAA